MLTAQALIEHYQLIPHPEGGFYRETFRSVDKICNSSPVDGFNHDRSYYSSIFFLLEQGDFSCFHRLLVDEIWHFYAGDPLTIIILHETGLIERGTLGSNIQNAEEFQYLVPANKWFAAYPKEGSAFSLVGCTTAPGFDYADFQMANREQLIKEYPHAKEIIQKLSREV